MDEKWRTYGHAKAVAHVGGESVCQDRILRLAFEGQIGLQLGNDIGVVVGRQFWHRTIYHGIHVSVGVVFFSGKWGCEWINWCDRCVGGL